MNSQFPPMPNLPGTPIGSPNPFTAYGYLGQGQQMSPEERQRQAADGLAKQIMGQPAANPMAGVGQMIAGAGMGLRNFQRPQNQFPTAPAPASPGGQAPGFGTVLSNFFTGNHNGGLF